MTRYLGPKTDPANVATQGDLGGMSLLDSQTFTSSTTYTMPAGAQIVVIECIGAGGGGGGGARNTSTSNAGGGGGGGGGGYYLRTHAAGQFAGTVTVTVPAGGTGGAGRTGSTGNGTRGNNGGMARFDWLYFFPGTFGNPGETSGNNGTAGQSQGSELTPRLSTVGSAGLGTGGRVGTNTAYKNIYGGGGGGGGSGAAPTAGVPNAGGESVQNADFSTALTSFASNNNLGVSSGGGGAAGNNAGDAGANGTNRAGGGGGRANTAGAGGNGGNGATPGGGGGGGGGANGDNNGGTGGTGGDGQIAIWVYG